MSPSTGLTRWCPLQTSLHSTSTTGGGSTMKAPLTQMALTLLALSSCVHQDTPDTDSKTPTTDHSVASKQPLNCFKLDQDECMTDERCMPIHGYSLDVKRRCSYPVQYAFCGDAHPTIDGVESVLFKDSICWFIYETEQVPMGWQDLGDQQLPGSTCDPMQFSNVAGCP